MEEVEEEGHITGIMLTILSTRRWWKVRRERRSV